MLLRQLSAGSDWQAKQAIRRASQAASDGGGNGRWRAATMQCGESGGRCGECRGSAGGNCRAYTASVGRASRWPRQHSMPLLLLVTLLMVALNGRTAAGYQQSIVHASFDHIGRPGLSAPLQIKCAGGGDRIHTIDLYYKINVCRAVEFRQTDAASERNLRIIEQCTGKRVCVVREYDMTSPFLDSKPGCLLGGGMQADELYLLYKCVPPDKVRPICSSFETLESEGYLVTSGYPQPINASEGKNPCVCDLRSVDASGASSSGRVYLSFAELDLGSDKSHLDPTSCQLAEQRQHVQIQYSYGMSSAYELCKHRYNYDVPPSQVFKVIFTNPISRETGKLWMLYKVIGERQDVLVRVKCYSLHRPEVGRLATPPPALGYSPPEDMEGESEPRKAGLSSLLLPLIIALGVFLVLIIGAAIIIMSIRHRRHRWSDHDAAGGAKPCAKKTRRRGKGVPEVCDDDDSRLVASRRSNGCGVTAGSGTPAATAAAAGAVGEGGGAGCEEKGEADVILKAACSSPDVASQATTATPSPPPSQADVLAGDCEMDVKSFRPYDTLIYTKHKARPSPDASSAASERTSLVGAGGGGPRYVTLPRKSPTSESEDDETSLIEQSSPCFASVSRQSSSRRDRAGTAAADASTADALRATPGGDRQCGSGGGLPN